MFQFEHKMADVENNAALVKRRRSSGGIRRNASHDISDHLEKAPHLMKVILFESNTSQIPIKYPQYLLTLLLIRLSKFSDRQGRVYFHRGKRRSRSNKRKYYKRTSKSFNKNMILRISSASSSSNKLT